MVVRLVARLVFLRTLAERPIAAILLASYHAMYSTVFVSPVCMWLGGHAGVPGNGQPLGLLDLRECCLWVSPRGPRSGALHQHSARVRHRNRCVAVSGLAHDARQKREGEKAYLRCGQPDDVLYRARVVTHTPRG